MMKAFTRRAVTAAVGGVAMVGLAAGPAAAHFCFKTGLNEWAAGGMAGSASWVSFEDIASSFLLDVDGDPLCDQGIQYLATEGGVELDTLINTHGTLAGGTLKKGESKAKTISHLDFEALDAAVPLAFEMCGQVMAPPPPPPA